MRTVMQTHNTAISSFHVTDTVHLQITQWFSLSELGISKTQYRRAE